MINLNGNNGAYTWANLTLASNGLLYGTTGGGGTKNDGTMFYFNPFTGKDSVLIDFDSANGKGDAAGNSIMQAHNGLLYGTTCFGGKEDSGVFYSYDMLTHKDSILFNFNNTIGAAPDRTVIEDTANGLLYGTTDYGGKNGLGVIYCYNPLTNKDSVVFNFDSVGENAAHPVGNTLIMASNGLFYGMTPYGGGPLPNGTLYSFNPNNGKDTTLVRFTGSNGFNPIISNLMQAKDGLLYGLTIIGGSNGDGVLFSFDITTNKQTILVNFNGTNGNEPTGDLVQDAENGLLYGITQLGGSNNMGVIFCYNPITGKDSVVVNFNGANGAYPVREPTLVRDTPNMVNELTAKIGEVRVYPNPSNGVFTIQCSMFSNKCSVQVYDMLGEEVYTAKLTSYNTTIDIRDKAEGIYLYRVITETGEPISQGKFIIQ